MNNQYKSVKKWYGIIFMVVAEGLSTYYPFPAYYIKESKQESRALSFTILLTVYKRGYSAGE